MDIEFVELSAVGGAEVRGVDIGQPPPSKVLAELEAAFDHFGMLSFRGQPLSARQLADFGRCLGPIQPHVQVAYQHPEVPEVVRMTNRKPDGSFDEVGARRGAIENTRDGWHSDLSYDPIPAKATLLHALEVPSSGGNTCFCNAHLAYEKLDERLKTRLDGLSAEFVYGGHNRNEKTQIAASSLTEEAQRASQAVHPVINAHPRTGRPAIYVNPLITTRVLGVSEVESEAILETLFDALNAEDIRFEHEWAVGDSLVWITVVD